MFLVRDLTSKKSFCVCVMSHARFYWTKKKSSTSSTNSIGQCFRQCFSCAIHNSGCCQVGVLPSECCHRSVAIGVLLALCCCRHQVVRIKSAVSSFYVLFDFFCLLHFIQHITQFALMCPVLLSFLSIVAKVSLYVMYCNST